MEPALWFGWDTLSAYTCPLPILSESYQIRVSALGQNLIHSLQPPLGPSYDSENLFTALVPGAQV